MYIEVQQSLDGVNKCPLIRLVLCH